MHNPLTHTSSLSALAMAVLLVAGISSCRRYDGKEAQEQRDSWIESLNDSIKTVSDRYTADSVALIDMRQKVAEEIGDFTTIDNPREVEVYYIYTPWRAKYPLASTGLAARILKSEGLELVAASKSRFSAIRVSAGNATAETEVVPADQALNYTANGLTTVAFTGEKADSVAMLIADNASSPVKIEYLNPGVTATYTLPEDVKQMIARTWSLCNAQKQTHLLEKAMSVGARKIEVLKITIDRENEKQKEK